MFLASIIEDTVHLISSQADVNRSDIIGDAKLDHLANAVPTRSFHHKDISFPL